MAAIYCPPWPKDLELTTTLYPVDVTDVMVFGIRVTGSAMALLPESDEQWSMNLQDGILQQERWFYSDGPYDSDEQWSMNLQDGILQQERWFYEDGPYDSDEQWGMNLQDGIYENKLVRVDTGQTGQPYEELQLGARPGTTGYLTLI